MNEGQCRRSDSEKDIEDELRTVCWYHYDLSRHAAEALLLSNGRDGSYLLRNSQEGPAFFALSVRAKDSVKHFHVIRKGNRYCFGFNEFPSLREFINHFANQPLLGSETGTLIVLKFPYPHTVEEPSIYESVRVHTAMKTGRTESDLVPDAPSLGTKEGYLVKQGGIIKNWKTRWFTLNRNELKYYKDKMVSLHSFVNGLHLYSAFLLLRVLKALYNTCLTFTIHTHIHTPVATAAMQGANLHTGSNLGFSVLLKDTLMGSGRTRARTCNLPVAKRYHYLLRHHLLLFFL
uniref:Dual adaptor of phosphotyrosine and 3-phosphoinositides n=1 Tax=Paramormyrops kingsleyae TaxID=1676925 RepID=A0A3B3Q4N9_9TELE